MRVDKWTKEQLDAAQAAIEAGTEHETPSDTRLTPVIKKGRLTGVHVTPIIEKRVNEGA